jgi:hypothetical protein
MEIVAVGTGAVPGPLGFGINTNPYIRNLVWTYPVVYLRTPRNMGRSVTLEYSVEACLRLPRTRFLGGGPSFLDSEGIGPLPGLAETTLTSFRGVQEDCLVYTVSRYWTRNSSQQVLVGRLFGFHGAKQQAKQ